MSSWLPLAGCLASSWLHSYHTHSTTPILWATKCQPFFFLSNHVSIQISLCRHKTQLSHSFCRLCDGLTGVPVLGAGLLHSNPGGHPGDPLGVGPQKDLHPFFLPLCSWALFLVVPLPSTWPTNLITLKKRERSCPCFTAFSTLCSTL